MPYEEKKFVWRFVLYERIERVQTGSFCSLFNDSDID